MPDFYDYGGRLQRKLEQIKNADGINDNNKRKIIKEVIIEKIERMAL